MAQERDYIFMKITFFIGGLSGGGAERVICNLANYIVEKGHDVEILTMSDDAPSYEVRTNVRRVVLLRSEERKKILYNSLLRLVRFRKYLMNTKADAIVVMLPVTTIMLLQMRRLTKATVIAAERSLPSVYQFKVQSRLKKLAHRADGWVFQTAAQKEWYENAGVEHSVIIPNAINPEFIKPLYKGPHNKEIVTVGRLTAPKNHELLISAFAKVVAELPDYRLVIYGEGPKLEVLKALANKLGVDDKVFFAGYTTNVYESIKDAALFVLSSDYEGMPNALMEAMATGLPCISTDCDGAGARELIDDGESGILVTKGDVDDLAAAMKKVLNTPDLYAKLGSEAHKICDNLFPARIYDEWENFIKETIKLNKQ